MEVVVVAVGDVNPRRGDVLAQEGGAACEWRVHDWRCRITRGTVHM